MLSFRGDAHKIYLRVKRTASHNQSFQQIKELNEIQEYRIFYETIDSDTLKTIYYRMIKEKNGSGIIPILVTSVPWFFFLFSKQLQHLLFHDGSRLWLIFSFVYLFTLTTSVLMHFREKAWAAVHIEIIKDILQKRNAQDSSKKERKSNSKGR